MTIIYKKLTEEYINDAVECMELSFEGDPLDIWLYNNPSKKIFRKQIREFSLRQGLKAGKKMEMALDDEKNKVVGIALWETPVVKGSSQSWGEWGNSWITWAEKKKLEWKYGATPVELNRFKDEAIALKNKIMSDERGFWYFHILGVHPDYQGKGISSKLIKDGLDEADKGGYRAYLESTKEVPNMIIYEKFGFKYNQTLKVEVDGKVGEVYCMVREAKS